jgi:hypothetical protein
MRRLLVVAAVLAAFAATYPAMAAQTSEYIGYTEDLTCDLTTAGDFCGHVGVSVRWISDTNGNYHLDYSYATRLRSWCTREDGDFTYSVTCEALPFNVGLALHDCDPWTSCPAYYPWGNTGDWPAKTSSGYMVWDGVPRNVSPYRKPLKDLSLKTCIGLMWWRFYRPDGTLWHVLARPGRRRSWVHRR